MSIWFVVTTVIFTLVSIAMILIILVQRPQGGGLAGAFGGAGGAGTETVFGGRVGDALTYATVTAFVLYLALAITLNLLDTSAPAAPPPPAAGATAPIPVQPVPPPEDAGTADVQTGQGDARFDLGSGQDGVTPAATARETAPAPPVDEPAQPGRPEGDAAGDQRER
jgi:preprotein translocase subunit SecG